MKSTITIYDRYGDEIECTPPGRYEVCPRCYGAGSHCNPSIDGNGITSSEMEELGEDFRRDYLAGVYDVTCRECGGDRVVWEIDWERWAATEFGAECARQYREQLEADAECDAISRMERMMGA